jgi:hypothetical protein
MITMFGVRTETWMIFSPIVLATAAPKKKGATNSQIPARRRAFLGEMALVMMMVDTTFAAS